MMKQPVNAKGQTEEEFLKTYDASRYPLLISGSCLVLQPGSKIVGAKGRIVLT